MGQWIKAVEDTELDEQLGVEVDGRRIALFRIDGRVYALDDICSHEFSLLSEGEIWDDEVYCPKHGSRFDIRSGAVRSLPAFRPVNSHPVKVENGEIFVEIKD